MNQQFRAARSDGRDQRRTRGTAEKRKRRKSPVVALFVLAMGALLAWAWLNRDTGLITATHGLGYWLGIIGASMMAALLLYPLRKRMRFARNLGRIPTWFKSHMVLGVLGPVLIIIHSNFEARSMNAFVALMAMFIVAGSGLVGRYLYVRIHRGLYGARLEARDLVSEAATYRESLGPQLAQMAGHTDVLGAYEALALNPVTTFTAALLRNLSLGRQERRVRRLFRAEMEARAERLRNLPRAVRRRQLREDRQRIRRYFRAVHRVANLALYERLFALWHVLHLPLIVLLVITAIIHIVAVHFY